MNAARIAVVGAGVGGLACARALQHLGHPVTVYEREPTPDSRWQGGMLDLHTHTGQAALRTAGLSARFEAVARPEAQELRALDPFTAALLHHELPTDGDTAAPEVDRGHLRTLLLDALEPGTVTWARPVDTVTVRDGAARLWFTDRTHTDVDLVIGADGAWSRVRPAVSDARPSYLGNALFETCLDDVDTRHPAIADLVGPGTLVAKDGRAMISAQRNSSGHVRVYAGLDLPADWHRPANIDPADPTAVRDYLLDRFATWHERLLDLLRAGETAFIHRPLHVLPVGHTWDHVVGATLLGDAAHLMPPYGIGANLALLDGTDLATAITTHPDLDTAVRAYETRMLPRSAAAAAACTDITAAITADTVVDVDAARAHLNDRLLNP